MVQLAGRKHNRRQVDKEQQERKAKSKGRYFSLRLQVPEVPIRVHFQRPTQPYADPVDSETAYHWFKGRKHYIPSLKKFIECAYSECLTCAYRNPQDFNLTGVQMPAFLKECWPKAYYCVCGWTEEWTRLLEMESDKKDEKGETKTYFERVIEKDIQNFLPEGMTLRDLTEKDAPRLFGKRFYFDINAPAWQNEFNEVFEQVERMTRDGGYLFPVNYVCANEECGVELFDMTRTCPSCNGEEIGIEPEKHTAFCGGCDYEWTLLEYRDKELKKRANAEVDCQECGTRNFPMVNLAYYDPESGEVTEEAPEEGWETFDIFDLALTIRTQKSTDNAPPRIVIDDWEIAEPDPRLFDEKFQGGKGDEDAKKMVEKHKEPLDIEKVHTRDVPAVQAKILDLPNLFSSNRGVANSRTSKRYTRGSAADREENQERTE